MRLRLVTNRFAPGLSFVIGQWSHCQEVSFDQPVQLIQQQRCTSSLFGRLEPSGNMISTGWSSPVSVQSDKDCHSVRVDLEAADSSGSTCESGWSFPILTGATPAATCPASTAGRHSASACRHTSAGGWSFRSNETIRFSSMLRAVRLVDIPALAVSQRESALYPSNAVVEDSLDDWVRVPQRVPSFLASTIIAGAPSLLSRRA